MLLAAVVMALGALGVLALGTAALLDLGPFAAPESSEPPEGSDRLGGTTEPPEIGDRSVPSEGLVVTDRLGDCRDARLDTGEDCDPGADIEAINLRQQDDRTILVELVLTEAPEIGPALAWTAEFYVEAANGYTDGGVICRLTSVTDSGESVVTARSYALDPNTVPRQLIDADACAGRLDGSTATFTVDVGGQPLDEPFRLIGLVRLEHPGDPDRVGSDDDFLVRATLADLRD